MNTSSSDQRAYRLSAIDALRGLAIVIMAIDHVRDFFLFGAEQDPMNNPNISVAIFATRWITHFCAPVFVLLAGTSAGLMTARKSPAELASFLFKRGLWLLLVECVVISTAMTFAPLGVKDVGGLTMVILQVISAIAISMMLLAGFQFMGRRACFVMGAVIIAGHNLLDYVWPVSQMFDQQTWPLWVALHLQMSRTVGPFMIFFSYPILPWLGVMLLGFGIAGVFELSAERRNTILLRSGFVLLAAFLIIRALDVYGDPNHWQRQPVGIIATVMDFLNTTKYGPSLLFLLMIYGPAAILCAKADRFTGFIKDALVMFGRVPFAFYVAHFFLIHALSILLGIFQGFSASQFFTIFLFYPKGYGLSLPGVYGVWMLVIVMLYPFCRWVAGVKARRRDWWLSYL